MKIRRIPGLLTLLFLCALIPCALGGCGKTPECEHLWDGGATVTAATHTAGGVRRFTCVLCGAQRTEDVPAIANHTFGAFAPGTEAGHTAACECGETVTEPHSFITKRILKAATVAEDGVAEKECTVCHLIVTDTITYEPGEIILNNQVKVIGPKYGTVTEETIDDCALLTEGYALTRVKSDESFGISVPVSPCAKDGLFVLSFKARAAEEYGKITATIKSSSDTTVASYSYHLCGQWNEYSLPFTSTGNEATVSLTTDGTAQTVFAGGVYISRAQETVTHRAPGGSRLIPADDWTNVTVSSADAVTGMSKCRDQVAVGDYLYAVGDGGLTVYRMNGTSPVFIKTVPSVGDLRQMSVTEDGKGLIVTGRPSGVFAFDISAPEDPILAAHIDSIEAATGIDVQKNYCFIADRTLGVDIFDISDLYHPVMVSNVRVGECQDCAVYNGYLYCGIWGACQVKICDVRNIDRPTVVGTISLSGRGDGIALSDGVLYAATGHHEPGQTGVSNAGYGYGNGMELYDITDPLHPKLLSIVRCDGRMYVNSPDIWRVTLAGNYAFLSSSYCGIYAFDVSDPKLPKRVAHFDVQTQKGASSYVNIEGKRDTFTVPFDAASVMMGGLIDCEVADGILYIADHDSGLYAVSLPDTVKETGRRRADDSTVFPNADPVKDYYAVTDDFGKMGLQNASVFRPGTQIWNLVSASGYLYVAAGSDGIYVLNEDLTVAAHYETDDIAMELQVYGNVLYVAESMGGLYTYGIDPSAPERLTKRGSCNIGAAVCSVQLSPGAKFALVQKSNASALIDVRDPDHPVLFENYSYTMHYQHQALIGAARDRYLMVFANGSSTVVLDFGEHGCYDAPVKTLWTSGLTAASGFCADGDFVFASQGTLYRFDPADATVYETKLADSRSVKAFPITAGGVPNVAGDWLFIARRTTGTYSVYRLNEAHTSATQVFSAAFCGNPYTTVVVGNRAYVPLGYEGLLAYDLPSGN